MNLWVVAIKLLSPLFSSLETGRKKIFSFFLKFIELAICGATSYCKDYFFPKKRQKNYEVSNLPQDKMLSRSKSFFGV